MAASIIVIGNPGSGKSTILNALAGEVLFKSGISIGDGLTYQLDERENARGTFFDTPGLADNTHREAAGKAISTALRKGGKFKVLFFVMTVSGRIVCQDVTTLRLVLDAVPEIENHYGIVINKLPENVAKVLQSPEEGCTFLTKLFAGIPDHQRCAQSNITYLPYHFELDAEDNKLIDLTDLKTFEGASFQDFVYGQVPTIKLTVGKAGDIATNDFDQMNSMLEAMEKKMEKDRQFFLEQQNLLKAQLEKAKADKIEQQEGEKKLHTQQMSLMEQLINQKDKDIEAAQNDTECRAKLLEEQIKLQMEQQKLQFQEQMARLAAQRPSSTFIDILKTGVRCIAKYILDKTA